MTELQADELCSSSSGGGSIGIGKGKIESSEASERGLSCHETLAKANLEVGKLERQRVLMRDVKSGGWQLYNKFIQACNWLSTTTTF